MLFASYEHPLVLFLDDLHWADQSSLQFLQILVSAPELKYIMLIGLLYMILEKIKHGKMFVLININ